MNRVHTHGECCSTLTQIPWPPGPGLLIYIYIVVGLYIYPCLAGRQYNRQSNLLSIGEHTRHYKPYQRLHPGSTLLCWSWKAYVFKPPGTSIRVRPLAGRVLSCWMQSTRKDLTAVWSQWHADFAKPCKKQRSAFHKFTTKIHTRPTEKSFAEKNIMEIIGFASNAKKRVSQVY